MSDVEVTFNNLADFYYKYQKQRDIQKLMF